MAMKRQAATLLCLFIFAVGLLQHASARISSFNHEHEDRTRFILSSFGLLLRGEILVTIREFDAKFPLKGVGLSLHRTDREATQYLLDETEGCIFDEETIESHGMRIPLALGDSPVPDINDQLDGVTVQKETINGSIAVLIFLNKPHAENMYTTVFHVCPDTSKEGLRYHLSLSMLETNPGPDFLGADEAQLPLVYSVMAGAFALATAVWTAVLIGFRKSPNLFKLHFVMLALVLFKALSLTFRAIDYHYIQEFGQPLDGWAVAYYIMSFVKGMLLFLTILLIGAGYGFIKHVLSKLEKRIFILVIPLQVSANIARIVLEESSESSPQRQTLSTIILIIDIICCFAILAPIVWSIKHLEAASTTDGKAALNLRKLRAFRTFYVMILTYIYLTRIMVFVLESGLPFGYEWNAQLFSEVVTLLFYCITGLMFSPKPDNQYFVLPDDEDDSEEYVFVEMDATDTSTGVAEGMRHTRTSQAAQREREGSHSRGSHNAMNGTSRRPDIDESSV